MAVGLSVYEASVAVHVAAVVVAFGPTFAYPFIQLAAERDDRRALPGAFATILWISRTLAVPAALVVGATGVYQLADGPHSLGDAWLAAGAALYVAILAVALGVLVPRLRRAGELAEEVVLRAGAGEPPELSEEYLRVRASLVRWGALIGAMVLVTVFLMEAKPG